MVALLIEDGETEMLMFSGSGYHPEIMGDTIKVVDNEFNHSKKKLQGEKDQVKWEVFRGINFRGFNAYLFH